MRVTGCSPPRRTGRPGSVTSIAPAATCAASEAVRSSSRRSASAASSSPFRRLAASPTARRSSGSESAERTQYAGQRPAASERRRAPRLEGGLVRGSGEPGACLAANVLDACERVRSGHVPSVPVRRLGLIPARLRRRGRSRRGTAPRVRGGHRRPCDVPPALRRRGLSLVVNLVQDRGTHSHECGTCAQTGLRRQAIRAGVGRPRVRQSPPKPDVGATATDGRSLAELATRSESCNAAPMSRFRVLA